MRIHGVWTLLGLLAGCNPSSPPAPETKTRSILEPRGVEEMKRVRKDVEDANTAGQQRNDDAIDRAAKSEAAGRGAPVR